MDITRLLYLGFRRPDRLCRATAGREEQRNGKDRPDARANSWRGCATS